MITRLWSAFRKLHLMLYFLFSMICAWGALTSSIFEQCSLVDVVKFDQYWEKSQAAQGHPGAAEPSGEQLVKAIHPLKVSPQAPPKRATGPGPAKHEKGDMSFSFGNEDTKGSGFVWLILLWLWPLYRHYFSRRKPDPALVERRIIGLPVFLFVLTWAMASYQGFVREAAYVSLYGAASLRIKLAFAVSALMFGTFVSYLNLELLQLYIRRYIARPFFMAHDPHGIRRGLSVNLTLRYTLMMFSLAIVPLLLALYVPVYFNWGIVAQLRDGHAGELIWRNYRVLIPCLVVAVMTVFLLGIQLVSILFYKWNVEDPIGSLVRRMQAVAAGDFTCKTSVLYSDEIGQLKGHFNLMLDGLVERERIKDTFGKYVSIEIAEKIMKSGKVSLAGEEIRATVLFCDIRNFTPLSERLAPTELIRFLNDYFAHITRPIVAHRGVINKFMGDAVMAVFSPVFGVEDHGEAALRAALGMREALREFNALGKYQPVAFGVGVHSGTLIAGNVGTENRLEYTVLGDTVNIASRIEGQTKQFSTEVLVSEAMLREIDRSRFPGLEFMTCGPVLMKGKSQPLELFRLADAAVRR